MKRLLTLWIGFVVAIAGLVETPVAWAATVYACACETGSIGGCVAGSNTSPYDTHAKAINTIAQWKTSCQALTNDQHLSTCQGGAFDNVDTGNMTCAATAANPVVIDSYDATGLPGGFSTGAGIRPKFNGKSTTAGVLAFNKGTITNTNGAWIKDIEVACNANATPSLRNFWGIIWGQDTDYMRLSNIKVTGCGSGIQVGSGGTVAPFSGDGKTDHVIIENSTISNNIMGILAAVSTDLTIEGNTFLNNGDSVGDHDIYTGGGYIPMAAKTVSSLTGNGTTATVVTSTPHLIPVGARFTVGMSSSSCTTPCTGTFNATGGFGYTAVEGVYVDANTFTYGDEVIPVTGNGTATSVGTYTATVDIAASQLTIRNNTMTDSNFRGAANCRAASIVAHGDWSNVNISNNLQTETSPGNAYTSCVGIEYSQGDYAQPEFHERFGKVVIRDNTTVNHQSGVTLDLCASCLVENHYHYSTYTGDTFAIRMRAKNYTPAALFTGTATAATSTTLTDSGKTFVGLMPGGSTVDTVVKITGGTGSGQRRHVKAYTSTQLTVSQAWTVTPDTSSTYAVSNNAVRLPHQEPDRNVLRYNTVYVVNPTAGSIGISLNANGADALAGTQYGMYGNAVVLGTSATVNTQCYNTQNMSLAMLANKDYNSCYYLGASVPKWDFTSSLATVQAGADANKSDLNSAFAATASVATGQPFFTTPTTSPATGASSALISAGHPSLKPYSAWGGFRRAANDRGAYSRGDATVIPNSPTRISVQ